MTAKKMRTVSTEMHELLCMLKIKITIFYVPSNSWGHAIVFQQSSSL